MKIIFTILLIGLSWTSFSQASEVAIPDDGFLILNTEPSSQIQWHCRPSKDTACNLVSRGNVYRHNRSEGSLIAVKLKDSLVYSVLDTINFKKPLANQRNPIVINNKIYNTVEIDGYTWLAEDYEDSLFTYQEAVQIANSVPGWMLPGDGHGKIQTPKLSLRSY